MIVAKNNHSCHERALPPRNVVGDYFSMSAKSSRLF
jgi:hypothetical protein